jgi:1-acyl-sn-glycerol-3-phosphate acyltransferase
LAPIQALLIVLYTLVIGLLAMAVCLVLPRSGAFAGLARFWSWLVLKALGVRFTASYHPRVDPACPSVYMANHQSQIDIPALVLAMPCEFRIVAKRELLFVPVFGWALWLAGFIFIDRGDRERAIRSLDRAARRVRSGTSIVVFAEGTRSPDGGLLPFKKGGFVLALQAGVPIVPVSIRGGHELLPKGSLRARRGMIGITFGEPIETSGYSLETKDSLIEAVRQRIVAGLAAETPLKST